MLPSRNHILVNEDREISFQVKREDQTLVEKAFNNKHVLWSVSACD